MQIVLFKNFNVAGLVALLCYVSFSYYIIINVEDINKSKSKEIHTILPCFVVLNDS